MMPDKDLYLQELDGSSIIAPKPLINPQTNLFENSFSVETNTEDWNDWMQWDGTSVETNVPGFGQENTFSTPSRYSYNAADLGTPSFFASTTSSNHALFDFDKPVDSSQSLATLQTNSNRPVRGYSTLTAAELQNLQNIAMPNRELSQVQIGPKPSSPTMSTSSRCQTTPVKPETRTRKKNKKQKLSINDDEVLKVLCQSRKRAIMPLRKSIAQILTPKSSLYVKQSRL
jgi:hypothetical protein